MCFGVASTEREKGLRSRTASICQQKSGLMKYGTRGRRARRRTWLTRCVSRNSLWWPPPSHLPLREAPCLMCSKLRPPSHQRREAAWGTGTSYARVPWGNDTEYKCTGRASDGPAHVEAFALQKRVVRWGRWGSQWQSDRRCWRLPSFAFRTADTAELAPARSSTSPRSALLHVGAPASIFVEGFVFLTDIRFRFYLTLHFKWLCALPVEAALKPFGRQQ